MLIPLVLLGITDWNSFLTGLLFFFSLYLIISISLNIEMGSPASPISEVLYFMGGAAFSEASPSAPPRG